MSKIFESKRVILTVITNVKGSFVILEPQSRKETFSLMVIAESFCNIPAKTEPSEEENEADDQGNETTDDESGTRTDDFETFNHRSPIAENEGPELPTDETVKAEIQAIIVALSGIVGQSPIDCDQGIETINEQIRKLAMVPQMLADIRDRTQQNQEAS